MHFRRNPYTFSPDVRVPTVMALVCFALAWGFLLGGIYGHLFL